MAVPAIALYASPPSSMYDFDSLSSRSIPSASTSNSTSQKPFVGGLSCLFSSSSVKHSSSSSYACGPEELSSLRAEELSSSFTCSFASYMKRDNSPVSVFQGPVSCSTSGAGSSRSPPMRLGRESSLRAGNDRLFTRHALASFVDYDSLSFQTRRDPVELEELTFNMDDQFKESSYESVPYAKDLLLAAQTRHKIFFDQVVVKAFCEAEKAHRGQVRASGDPYLQHCVETAVLLAMIGADSAVVAAGLLHDTLDDSFMSYDYILQTFGGDVADLVEGVSKLSQLSKLARESNTANRTVEADRLHTMFLAMADVRVVLIKLADRLHNMITLEALPIDKQRRFAKETSEIFAPLANRLGIASWKEQLENLCFKHLNPELHKGLSSQLVKSFDEAMVSSAAEKLEHALKDNNIYHVLSGRHKSLYSIHCKMLKKKLTMDEIHDIHGVRLIVDNKEDCYKALEIVHQLWSEVPGKFKDYINHPKDNGYQSLHTVVMGEGSVPLEVQIRTKAMHLQAEFGFAAHWRYKEGDCKHSSFVVQRVEWARWVLTWQSETMINEKSSTDCSYCIKAQCTFPFHSEDCPYVYKPNGNSAEPVFVVTIENDKMSVQEFPANSTIMDLLERAGRGSSGWTPDGFPKKEELMPRVNNVPVSDPTCKLKMGDKVELSPTIPDRALTDYREEIQRMYDRDLSVSSTNMRPAGSTIGWRR